MASLRGGVVSGVLDDELWEAVSAAAKFAARRIEVRGSLGSFPWYVVVWCVN